MVCVYWEAKLFSDFLTGTVSLAIDLENSFHAGTFGNPHI